MAEGLGWKVILCVHCPVEFWRGVETLIEEMKERGGELS